MLTDTNPFLVHIMFGNGSYENLLPDLPGVEMISLSWIILFALSKKGVSFVFFSTRNVESHSLELDFSLQCGTEWASLIFSNA